MTDQEGMVAPDWRGGVEFDPTEMDSMPDESLGAEPSTDEPVAEASEVDAGPDWQNQYQQAQGTIDKLTGDINSLKSNYDRNIFQMQQDFRNREEMLNERLAELEMADMDDEQRAAYLQQRELDRLENTAQSLDAREWQLQQRESMLAWEDYFVNRVGVNPTGLDKSQGFETFHAQGWQGVELLVNDLRTRNAQLEGYIKENNLQVPNASAVARPAMGKTPPKVQTKAPGPPPSKRRMADIPVHEREALFAAFEAGEISADELPV